MEKRQSIAAAGNTMVPKRSILIGVSATMALLFRYLGPVLFFGEVYRHEQSGSTYEFRDGRFIENGKGLGHYTLGLRRAHIVLENIHDVEFDATIGWASITMPIPKYGMSTLIKERSAHATIDAE